ncbi:AI-2E family transporter [uncultured Sphaerochaeta sp.]|uniref:AI-2E family transporter n=1 Tax=uncultured Sphaerochaeta sp. TaxID=886478 RepID=UPI0029CA1331|nr:AI-2E family transporter [uncultured Sphaerochaeta sp.]
MMDKKTFRSIVHLLILTAALALGVVYFSTVQAGLKKLWGLLMPLILGIVFAYLVDIPAKWMENRVFGKLKSPLAARVIAVFISLIFFLVLITGVLILLLPQLGLAVRQFSTNLPVLYQDSVSSLEQFMHTRPELEQGFSIIEGYINTFVENLRSSSPKIADYALSLLGGAINGVVNAAIALVFSIYLLFGKRRLLSQLTYLMERFIPEKYCRKIVHVKVIANRTFGKFFTGQFVEAIILGSLCTLGMLLFRFPYALTVGSVVGMTAIIPLVGAYLGGAIGFVLLFNQGFKMALLFVLFLVILQQLEGNIIYPRVVGTSVGLPGVWVFTAVILGGGLFGIPGILFGVPFVATIYQLLKAEKEQESSVD